MSEPKIEWRPGLSLGEDYTLRGLFPCDAQVWDDCSFQIHKRGDGVVSLFGRSEWKHLSDFDNVESAKAFAEEWSKKIDEITPTVKPL